MKATLLHTAPIEITMSVATFANEAIVTIRNKYSPENELATLTFNSIEDLDQFQSDLYSAYETLMFGIEPEGPQEAL